MPKPFRRIVTGHNRENRAVIASDAHPDRVFDNLGEPGLVFYEVWNTRETPARIDRSSGEPREERLSLPPPRNGTRIRVLDIPSETERTRTLNADTAQKHFELIGGGAAHSAKDNVKHPYMHRTESIDYGIVLKGEIYLIMDEEEVLVRQGDIVVQRGTNHAWSNRSGKVCRIAFILIDGKFDEDLKAV